MNQKGFSLIEILIVIAIIGILASILLANARLVRQRSRDARRIVDIGEIQKALAVYFDANGSFPVGDDAVGLDQLQVGGFMPVVPIDPTTRNSYRYTEVPTDCLTGCTNYHLGANLEEPRHPSLDSDADTTDGFNGVNGTCESSSGDDLCYDLVP